MQRLPVALDNRLAALAGLSARMPDLLIRLAHSPMFEKVLSALEQEHMGLVEELSCLRAAAPSEAGVVPRRLESAIEIAGVAFIPPTGEQFERGIGFARITATKIELHCPHSHIDKDTGEPLISVGNCLTLSTPGAFCSYRVHVISIRGRARGKKNTGSTPTSIDRQATGFKSGFSYRHACIECAKISQESNQQKA